MKEVIKKELAKALKEVAVEVVVLVCKKAIHIAKDLHTEKETSNVSSKEESQLIKTQKVS